MQQLECSAAPGFNSPHTGERIQRILSNCGLSVGQLEAISRTVYGQDSPFYIPASFLVRLKSGVSPHLCQVVTLSRISGYTLSGWLHAFGFNMPDVTRLQLKVHPRRTLMLHPAEGIDFQKVDPASAPGSALLLDSGRYQYLRIGAGDGMAFPELVPGTVIRVDLSRRDLPGLGQAERPLVVEHLSGLTCCRVARLNRDEILLLPQYLGYPCLCYRLGHQAVIRGTPDAELRPLINVQVPVPEKASGREWRSPVGRPDKGSSPGQMLRWSRERLGIRFREAHRITEQVAAELGDQEFAIALGSLSDYEASDFIPRHIAKVISLCIAYAMDLAAYLRSAGIEVRHQGVQPVYNAGEWHEPFPAEGEMQASLLPASILDAFIAQLSAETRLSDLVLVPGQEGESGNAPWFLIDRKARDVRHGWWHLPWERPQYLVRHRSGRLLHGFCTIHDGHLTIHQITPGFPATTHLLMDVEIIGRAVAILRKLG